MGTDIINKIESLNTKRFTDYQYLAFDIRAVINSYATANLDKRKIDKDHDGFFFRANSLDYINSVFNKKLSEFISNFFYNEELIRGVIALNTDTIDLIKIDQSKYFHPIFGQNIGRIEYGPSSLDKVKVSTEYFNKNYKSGYYTKTKKSSEGCFVATFAYESYEHENVVFLRKTRDEVLSKSIFGRAFIVKYYEYSPRLVKVLDRIKFPKWIISSLLNWMVFVIRQIRRN